MAAGWIRRDEDAAGLPNPPLASPANDSSESNDARFAHAAHVAQRAEQRAIAAVSRLADDVARLADALNRRMDTADARASAGLGAVRTEVRQLEELIARRLAQGASAHGESVQALRQAMAEAIERLTWRMDEVENAAARSADSVSRRVEALEARVESGHARLLEAVDGRTSASEARLRRLVGEIRAEGWTAGPRPPPRQGVPPLIAAILVLAAGAATVSVCAVGYQLAAGRGSTNTVRVRIPALPLRPRLGITLPPSAAPAPAPLPRSPAPERPRAAPPPTTSKADFAALAQATVAGDRQALARLQQLATDGAPLAQLLLGKLYEDGQGGLPRDMAQARMWTQRAAEGGERSAMHNLGLFLMNGEGGPVDMPAAARWFERAATAGVVDAQFNLALLYEAGRGVPRNLAVAYRWYSIAANAGDGMARARAVALEARLTPAERTAAGKAAAAFQPGGDDAQSSAPVLAGAATVAETQRLLARGGYYIGETDGVDSPAYRTALQAYAKEHAGAAPAP